MTAEYGVAAHWKYKTGSGEGTKPGDEEKFAWIRRLLETQQESDAQDFFHNLKVDMFADEVFVFSPKGDVINLPAGATPIDFAYSIHSAIGNSMVGATVNGRIVNFDYVLQNGDIVDIRTSKNAPGPSRDWLNLAKSGAARTKIKQWFKKERREENIVHGKEQFERELRANGIAPADIMGDEILPLILKRLAFTSLDDLYAAIGYGGVTATRTVNRIRDEILRSQKANQKNALDRINEAAERRSKRARHAVHGILVEGLDNCLIKFSRCCTPVPGDSIIGFITRGAGVSIHRTDCENYLASRDNPETAGRWIRVSWAEHPTDSYSTTLMLLSAQRSGLVMDVATALNALNAKVRTLTARDVDSGRRRSRSRSIWPSCARSSRLERHPRRHPHLAQRRVRPRAGRCTHRRTAGRTGRAKQQSMSCRHQRHRGIRHHDGAEYSRIGRLSRPAGRARVRYRGRGRPHRRPHLRPARV